MAPVERNKFGAPMFEPEAFRKQMKAYCFEKIGYDIAVTFCRPPVVIRRSRNCAPLTSRYVSGAMQLKSENFLKINKFSSQNVINFYSMNICNFRTQY